MSIAAAKAAAKTRDFIRDFACSSVTGTFPADTLILIVSLAWIRRQRLPFYFWGGAAGQ
jgi:hypothetical protein